MDERRGPAEEFNDLPFCLRALQERQRLPSSETGDRRGEQGREEQESERAPHGSCPEGEVAA